MTKKGNKQDRRGRQLVGNAKTAPKHREVSSAIVPSEGRKTGKRREGGVLKILACRDHMTIDLAFLHSRGGAHRVLAESGSRVGKRSSGKIFLPTASL